MTNDTNHINHHHHHHRHHNKMLSPISLKAINSYSYGKWKATLEKQEIHFCYCRFIGIGWNSHDGDCR